MVSLGHGDGYYEETKMPRTMLERIESMIKDNIEAALPKGVSVDYHYAAVSVLHVLSEPNGLMIEKGCNILGEGHDAYSVYQAMIAAARD